MPNTHADLTQDLADLIRYQRKEELGLSQKAAAAAAGGMSEVYWRQIETRHPRAVESVTSGMVARMAYSVDVSPERLRAIGQHHIADLVQRRRELREPENPPDAESALEGHIMAAPGLTEGNRTVLVSVALGLLRGQSDSLGTLSA